MKNKGRHFMMPVLTTIKTNVIDPVLNSRFADREYYLSWQLSIQQWAIAFAGFSVRVWNVVTLTSFQATFWSYSVLVDWLIMGAQFGSLVGHPLLGAILLMPVAITAGPLRYQAASLSIERIKTWFREGQRPPIETRGDYIAEAISIIYSVLIPIAGIVAYLNFSLGFGIEGAIMLLELVFGATIAGYVGPVLGFLLVVIYPLIYAAGLYPTLRQIPIVEYLGPVFERVIAAIAHGAHVTADFLKYIGQGFLTVFNWSAQLFSPVVNFVAAVAGYIKDMASWIWTQGMIAFGWRPITDSDMDNILVADPPSWTDTLAAWLTNVKTALYLQNPVVVNTGSGHTETHTIDDGLDSDDSDSNSDSDSDDAPDDLAPNL